MHAVVPLFQSQSPLASSARAGEKAAWRFIEFFTANIRNKNTRAAYAHAVTLFFDWSEKKNLRL